MLSGLNFIMLHVPDVAEARKFYTEKLGFSVEDEQPGFVQFKQPSGATFAIAQNPADSQSEDVELWWFVDNADTTFAQLVEQGVEVVHTPTDEPFGRTFSIKDPAGHRLYMLQLAQSG